MAGRLAQRHRDREFESLNRTRGYRDDWRGPIVASVIRQFYEQVRWSELDFLLIDLPPGTSDAPLTVLQSLSIDGVVLVTMPQALATMVVRKAANLIEQ